MPLCTLVASLVAAGYEFEASMVISAIIAGDNVA